MPYRLEKKRHLLRQLHGHADQKLKGAPQADLKRFVREYYANTLWEDIAALSTDHLFFLPQHIWDFGATRKIGQTLVRVLSPDYEEGFLPNTSLVEIISDNMPFLVDSVTNELQRLDLSPHFMIYPTFETRRTAAGKRHASGTPITESYMQIFIPRLDVASERDAVRHHLQRVLRDVLYAVEDWKPTISRLDRVISDLSNRRPASHSITQAVEFLKWLKADHFIFLGYCEYVYKQDKGEPSARARADTRLGFLKAREPNASGMFGLLEHNPKELSAFIAGADTIMITKASRRSTIHRRTFFDVIGIKKFDARGTPVGEYRFIGLFTSLAYTRSVQDIPLLRDKFRHVLSHCRYPAGGHDHKALVHVLETFPKDDLFQIDVDTLLYIAQGVVQLGERGRAAVFVRNDRFDRYVSALVYLPRDVLSTDLRLKIEDVLERGFNGRVSNYYLSVTDSPMVRLSYIVVTPHGIDYDLQKIQGQIAALGKSWQERLREAMEKHPATRGYDATTAKRLLNAYGSAFGIAYQNLNTPDDAVIDINLIRTLTAAQPLRAHIGMVYSDEATLLNVRLYHLGSALSISEVLPIIENLGLKAHNETTFEVQSKGMVDSTPIFLHSFFSDMPNDGKYAVEQEREKFCDAFLSIWQGRAENDSYNRLVISAGLTWQQAVVWRAYGRYLKQAGVPFSQDAICHTLVKYPNVTRLLMDSFESKFDPDFRGNRDKHLTHNDQRLNDLLDDIPNPDDDRIIRDLMNVLAATVRTNYYQTAYQQNNTDSRCLAFKFDSPAIEILPSPKPRYEIYVYSPRVEGVHLRGGKVARGGIRWSERQEDFRTEVLGLMKAQMVKNTVIVPVGSKGGFIARKIALLGDPAERQTEVREAYKLFVSALLSITDTYRQHKVVHPDRVVWHDENDPYLVVAADKGTAMFSDTANALSAAHDFWLKDAFASGGSNGYDHKKIAITARGAWISVQRHFREIGIDVQTQPFTVTGVGDMSGDVFGNGMLQSDKILLRAAFDHRHIFVDPAPDAAISFKERERLFHLPRSSWADYDAKKLSAGGHIYSRQDKILSLTPEIQAMLGLKDKKVTPNALMRAILLNPTDLLFFGGIGTFVKASDENHADVGDRGNDTIRIDGSELRARVVGEGANLGMTQRGRIEYAQHGGRLNTDAIDNSGGVNCSDYEVNIKILLNEQVDRKKLSLPARNTLLRRMEPRVAEKLLYNNYLQTQALSLASAHGAGALDGQRRFMAALEKTGLLRRSLEHLPNNDDIAERQKSGDGLTRPENAILLSYAKMSVYSTLVTRPFLNETVWDAYLFSYFPKELHKTFGRAIRAHRLRNEIIATQLTNDLVNRMGATFVFSMQDNAGASVDDVARAYFAVKNIFGTAEMFHALEKTDGLLPATEQYAHMMRVQNFMERVVTWFVTKYRGAWTVDTMIDTFKPAVDEMCKRLRSAIGSGQREAWDTQVSALTDRGVPESIAARLASLSVLVSVCEVTQIARQEKASVAHASKVYQRVGYVFALEWLIETGRQIVPENDWRRRAIDMFTTDVQDIQAHLVVSVMRSAKKNADPDTAIDGWRRAHPRAALEMDKIMGSIREAEMSRLTVSALAVISNGMRHIVDRL